MANGLPVVLSDIPSMAFAHRSPGAVFSVPGDSRSLAEAVRAVLHWTPDQRRQRCQANQELVRNEFDVQTWARRILDHYHQILDR
jgi:glycosyltransferase involved in cell wall biosynthesis